MVMSASRKRLAPTRAVAVVEQPRAALGPKPLFDKTIRSFDELRNRLWARIHDKNL